MGLPMTKLVVFGRSIFGSPYLWGKREINFNDYSRWSHTEVPRGITPGVAGHLASGASRRLPRLPRSEGAEVNLSRFHALDTVIMQRQQSRSFSTGASIQRQHLF